MAIRLAKSEWMLAAGLALAILLGPLVLRGNPEKNALLERNTVAYSRLTDVERTRLERNYERFQQMPSDEQKHWRAFHATLQSDRQSAQPRLGPALDVYYGWLSTVPAYRREELRKTNDPEQRIALVKDTVDDQLAKRLSVTESWSGSVRLLGSADVQAIMNLFEGRLLEQEREALVDVDGNELRGLPRSLQVLVLLKQRYGQAAGLLRDGTFAAAVREIVPDDRQRREGDRPFPPLALLPMLRLSLMTQLEAERRKLAPSTAALNVFLESLPPEEQEALYHFSAQEFYQQLERRYLEQEFRRRYDVELPDAMAFLAMPRDAMNRDAMNRGPGGDRPERGGILRPGRELPRRPPRGQGAGPGRPFDERPMADRGLEGRRMEDRPFDGGPPDGRPQGNRSRGEPEREPFRPN